MFGNPSSTYGDAQHLVLSFPPICPSIKKIRVFIPVQSPFNFGSLFKIHTFFVTDLENLFLILRVHPFFFFFI
ncbi:hypothetical protein HanXRQr2_Chr03g0135571 [Helianthus annuus]|uniref:Uncharacterized protein n=1 Tax=Helianthus annuus TaxID=4232 RepID=A0A9K3JJX9_HELAN|nr:hypothetical protein HanXRQr2_Chr03g0135571 [Helianthus annuus]KAJ0603095.1 hypothetical protein HanIR_Chr03g0146791 [Helianthus annuus]KAJ0945801.1 hypothetical protein HanPSC8_Chr03g0132141 [Helianthus annuus]